MQGIELELRATRLLALEVSIQVDSHSGVACACGWPAGRRLFLGLEYERRCEQQQDEEVERLRLKDCKGHEDHFSTVWDGRALYWSPGENV